MKGRRKRSGRNMAMKDKESERKKERTIRWKRIEQKRKKEMD